MKTTTKEPIAIDAENKWDLYTIMDFTVAFVLVVVSMVSADIPRHRIEIVRRNAPYTARGWRPVGQQFDLPLKAQPPTPAPSYGPPPEEPSTTTTEQPTTTEASTESENLEVAPQGKEEEKAAKIEEQPGQYYVVLPQEQNFVYTVPRSATLLATVPRSSLMAIPARIQAVPIASAAYSPYSTSFIQIYQ